MAVLLVILSVAAGLFMAMQSPTNATLSRYVGDQQSTVISFGGGTLLLLAGTLLFGHGDVFQFVHAPFWTLLGGAYGVYLVLMITRSVKLLGVALTLTLVSFGEVVSGMVIDSFGWFGTDAIPVRPLRVVGAAVIFLGILVVYLAQSASTALEPDPSASGAKAPGRAAKLTAAVLTFIAGIGATIQTPTNAALGTYTGSLEATLWSFFGGTVIILAITLMTHKGRLNPVRGIGVKPWMLVGGMYGAMSVFFSVLLVPKIGSALLMASIMLGQLLGGLLTDSFGWLRTPKISLDRRRILGILIIAAGVVLVTAAML